MRILRWLMLMSMVALATRSLPAQDKIAAGVYKGTWTGAAGGGDFHLTLKSDGKGGLMADVGFSIEGAEVPGKVVSLKIDGAKLEIVYDFDLQGAKLESAAEGSLREKTLSGTYKTSADGSAVDQGTWKTTAQ